MRFTKLLYQNYLLALLLIFGAIMLSINIQKPFIGHHDFNSAFSSQIALNLTRYNILDTKLGLVSGSGPLDPKNLSYSTHIGPLHYWLLALSFYLFGQGEFQARIVSVFASLGITFFVYKISEKLFSLPVAVLATLLFITSPMIMYFGSNVFPEPLTIAFALASFYFFILWMTKKHIADFYFLLLFSLLSMLVVWGSYFLPPLLALYYFFFEKNRDLKKTLIIGLVPLFVFGLFLIHLFVLNGTKSISGLIFAFTSRMNVSLPQSQETLSLKVFLLEEFHRTIAYYSKTTILLSLGWILLMANEIVKKRYETKSFLLLVLLLWGVSYPLIFQKAAFIHDYFLIYLAPFIAISASVFSIQMARNISRSFLRISRSFLRISKAFPRVKSKNLTLSALAILILGLPAIQVLETKNFTSALLSTNGNRQGRELGQIIVKSTNPYDKILVLSGQFGAFFGVFTNYYGDRKIIYSDYSLEDFQRDQVDEKYSFIVYIEGRDTKEDVAAYLASRYPFTKNGIFTVFKTRK